MSNKICNRVCPENECVKCNACVQICPKGCVKINERNPLNDFAEIDVSKCISCHLCGKTCPQNDKPIGYISYKCFAAWALDKEIRQKSASGGVAQCLYLSALSKGYAVVGVSLDSDLIARYHFINNKSSLSKFRNSKYVFSDTNIVYKKIDSELKQGKKILFIGLPCHVAGLKKYLLINQTDTTSLLLVDLICHGVTPSSFLQSYTKEMERKYRRTILNVNFRDYRFETQTYTMTLEDNSGIFYKRTVNRNDPYQIGYHSAITYRESCYRCRYASKERQGDITLSDFGGVGKKIPTSYSNHNVSCILVNSPKGEDMLDLLADIAFLEERPIEEEWETEKQLSCPSVISKERKMFVRIFAKTGDFVYSVKHAARKRMIENEIKHYIHFRELKKLAHRILRRTK